MTIFLLGNLFFAGFSSMTVTVRIGFAMARDGAFPGSAALRKVHDSSKQPWVMIILVFAMDCLFCLLPLITPLAFAAITSITTIGYQISYAIPILLRLTVSRNVFKVSTFSLGRFSKPIGWISVVWLLVTSTFFIWPNTFDDDMQQEVKTFNYTCVVVGGFFIVAMIWWFVAARKYF